MIRITPQEARVYMLGQLRLNSFSYSPDREGLNSLLTDLRCIQLDPLSPMGTSPDMVALARIEHYTCNDLFNHLLPGCAFEHFAKERCLLPADAFPWYRNRISETPWWRLSDRLKKVPESVLEAVFQEIREHGPLTSAQLTDHGRVEPMDYSGWKSSAKMGAMALSILWTRCRIVVAGRIEGREKLYDVPERALKGTAMEVEGHFGQWAVVQRVEAAGLLARSGGPHWSMLEDVRTSQTPDKLLEEVLIEEVMVEGSTRRYLAPAGFRHRIFPEPDDHLRILGPLDPLIWNRNLTEQMFGFQYIWEVYKPQAQRRWGWYVCPLLHQGRLVGRLEGRVVNGQLDISKVWEEEGERVDRKALDRALKRHARACGVKTFTRPKQFLKSSL